jgi:hypothetical protein
MESTPKTTSEAKQPEAQHSEELPKAVTEKEGSHEATPPREGGNNGNANQRPPAKNCISCVGQHFPCTPLHLTQKSGPLLRKLSG